MTNACKLFVFWFACHFVSFFSSIHAECLDDQRSYLNGLIFHQDQENLYSTVPSDRILKWNKSMDCCKWEGVLCDSAGHVIKLNLVNKEISSGKNEDWKSIFNLQHLVELDLSWSYFGQIAVPEELYNLTRLKYLNLSGSDFTGQIPIGLSKLTSLVTLDLSHAWGWLEVKNPGGLKVLFQNLTQLEQLYLGGLDISAGGNAWCNAFSPLSKLQVLSLTACELSGPILPSLSNLSSLTTIQLDYNPLNTPIPHYFSNFTNLRTLSLKETDLIGQFPEKIFQIPTLESLDLSDNEFLGGSLPHFLNTGSLQKMSLSRTNFSGSLPDSIGYLKALSELDLSYSSFSGSIPSFSMSPKLIIINLSHNAFTGALSSSHFKGLIDLNFIDLGDNSLSGSFPSSLFALPSLQYLQLSYNHFDGEIEEIQNASSSSLVDLDLQYMSRIVFFSLSHNNIQGDIPKFICNGTSLSILNLSNNFFRGKIPECLFSIINENFGVLNLGGNKLSGDIPDKFRHNCGLRTLDLSRNSLRGKIPTSLANCKSLQLVNVDNNYLEDNFPCILMKSLIVLVLRSNRFHGEIYCSWDIQSLQTLHILDVSYNNFSGALPPQLFLNCRMIVADSIGDLSDSLEIDSDYQHSVKFFMKAVKVDISKMYQDSVRLIYTGLNVELVKALTIYKTLDFSCNNFQGNIPIAIGELQDLYTLNLSHNALTGKIPISFRKLKLLASLDLSTNQLTGRIPSDLADLTFLQVLNLSYNLLSGKIPNGGQFQTFLESSFLGNKGLCGIPLNVSCDHGLQDNGSKKKGIKWEFVSAALGFSVGIGIILWMNFLNPAWWQRFNSLIVQFLFLRVLGVDVLERSYRNPIRRV